MSKFIDADYFVELISKVSTPSGAKWIEDKVNKTPEARIFCRECKYFDKSNCFLGDRALAFCTEDDYCSKAKRV